jgi:GT2 family glycosyltransferase
MKLAVAVVSWKAPVLLKRCVESLVKFTPGVELELILCLNEHRGPLPELDVPSEVIDTVIASRKNICVEGMMHLALEACRQPYLLRLDDDSHVMREGWWDILRAELEGLPPTWGALGRLHKFGCLTELPPQQGYVSKAWIRKQPWYKAHHEASLHIPFVGVSGGFCVLNVKAAIQSGYPSDEYPHFEEDIIMGLQMKMSGFTLHNSNMIMCMAKNTNGKSDRPDPYIAIGDAPSRTDRETMRPKWKGSYEEIKRCETCGHQIWNHPLYVKKCDRPCTNFSEWERKTLK